MEAERKPMSCWRPLETHPKQGTHRPLSPWRKRLQHQALFISGQPRRIRCPRWMLSWGGCSGLVLRLVQWGGCFYAPIRTQKVPFRGTCPDRAPQSGSKFVDEKTNTGPRKLTQNRHDNSDKVHIPRGAPLPRYHRVSVRVGHMGLI